MVVGPEPLQLVVGKGGVGKSTVAAALALRAHARNDNVLVAEFGAPGGVARLFGADTASSAEPVEVRPGLFVGCFAGDAALAEYLEIVVPIRRLLSTVFESKLYRYFVAAAPGLKELMTVGKVWYEHQKVGKDGKRAWDVIVVDAGASGHSLQYLQMPATAARAFRSGLVHRESERVQALLRDPALTAVHVVATPEDMPLAEGRQILDRLAGDLELPIGTVFVNRCRRPSPPGTEQALDDLDTTRTDARAIAPASSVSAEHAAALQAGIVAAGRRALGWERIQENGIARFERETGRSVVRLPLLASEEFGLRDVEWLAGSLDGEQAEGTT